MIKIFKNQLPSADGFFVLLAVGAIFFGGVKSKTVSNDGSDSNPTVLESQKLSATQKSNSGSSLTSPLSDSIPIGSLVSLGKDYAVQIEGSELVDSISVEHPFMKVVTGNGEQLLVVYVTFKNTGNESGDMLREQFQLVDDQARKYDEIEDAGEKLTVWTWLDSKGLSKADDQLSPGSTAKTAKIFRVASDAAGLKVSVNNITLSLR